MPETIFKDKNPQREATYNKLKFDTCKCNYLNFESELHQKRERDILRTC